MYKLIFFLTTLFVLSLGCKNPDYPYSLVNFKESGDKTLLIMHQGYYDHYTYRIYDLLSELSSNLTFIYADDELEPFDFKLTDFDQIWIFDLREKEPNVTTQYMLNQVADWFNAHPEKNIILDTRFLFSCNYPQWNSPEFPEKQLLTNYFYNLKVRGGGLVIGTDHAPQFVYTANYVLDKLKFDLIGGITNAANNRLEVEPTHPLLFYPVQGSSSEIDDKKYLRAGESIAATMPVGLQENGIFLHTFGYSNAIGGNPHITTSIAPSDFTFEKFFLCEQNLTYSDEWELGEVTKFHSNTEIEVRLRSNLVGTYFLSKTEDSIIKASLPKYPGEHRIYLKLTSKSGQFLYYVFNVTVQLETANVGCDEQTCLCDLDMECKQEKNITITNIVNEGYFHIDPKVTLTIKYDDSNTTIINSTNGVVDIKGGNIVIIVPDNSTYEKSTAYQMNLLVGNYIGEFDSVEIQLSTPRKCEKFETEVNYNRKHISVAFTLKDTCTKWWVYALIALGVFIVVIAILLVTVFSVKKLRQRFLPFSTS